MIMVAFNLNIFLIWVRFGETRFGTTFQYLALHLRFEVDMVAYSLCDFGGGQVEKDEVQIYRETHFLLLMQRLKKSKPVSAEELRSSGGCPLTPEEAALVLSEYLLTPTELAPFKNFSSQLAALDFIACATSDVFAITDSGSQLSSLVLGFRKTCLLTSYSTLQNSFLLRLLEYAMFFTVSVENTITDLHK
ncbi:hypothetical protein L2E82_49687 [Cichorium intybus]|uniref:Uncharacterized protein n=1 Tax=Cichorium intybus TaxID=13427 RepID=A0ACB8Z146_CICIN|nr:hypothetical protein L2E82_49687 [Cichorium intybus]